MLKWLANRATVLFALLILFSSAAYADGFRLRIENTITGQGMVVTDNGAGDAAGSQAGVIQFSGSLGGFIVNVTTGVSKPLIGGVNNYAELDLNSINVYGSGPGTLRITLEDDSYTLGPNGPTSLGSLVGGTLTAPAGSSVAFQSWANAGNAVMNFGADTAVPTLLAPIGAVPAGSVAVFSTPLSFGPGAFSGSGSADFTKSGSYSMFSQATLNFTGSGMVSFDQNTSAVPEPASLVLLGSGLVGVGLLARKRKATQS